MVNVLRKCDKNRNTEWWLVEQDGRQGYIPDSFLKEVKKSLTRSMSDGNDLNTRQTITPILRPLLTSGKNHSTKSSREKFHSSSKLSIGKVSIDKVSSFDKTEVVGHSKFYTSENDVMIRCCKFKF